MTTIYAYFGEDTSVNTLTSRNYVNDSSDNNYFRTNFSRAALTYSVEGQAAGYDTANPAQTFRLRTPNFGSQTTLWTHYWNYIYFAGTGGFPPVGSYVLAFMDSSSIYRLAVRADSSYNNVKLSTCNSSGTWVDVAYSSAGALNGNVFNQNTPLQALDFELIYGTSGTFNMWVNGNLALTYSGNLVTESTTGIALVDIIGPSSISATFGSNAHISEAIVQSTDTRGIALCSLPPLSVGSASSWTGAIGNVSKTNINDTTYITATTSGQQNLYNIATALPAGNWTVKALITETRSLIGQTGPQNTSILTQEAGTLEASAISSPTNYFNNSSLIQQTNPVTGAAFTAADFANGIQIGVEALT